MIENSVVIYQSTTFKYDTSEEMGDLFDLKASGYFYTRLQNPTNDAVAAKICALEGGVAAMLTSSGQAASFYSIFNLCEAGDHFVSSSCIYGGTYNLLRCWNCVIVLYTLISTSVLEAFLSTCSKFVKYA